MRANLYSSAIVFLGTQLTSHPKAMAWRASVGQYHVEQRGHGGIVLVSGTP